MTKIWHWTLKLKWYINCLLFRSLITALTCLVYNLINRVYFSLSLFPLRRKFVCVQVYQGRSILNEVVLIEQFVFECCKYAHWSFHADEYKLSFEWKASIKFKLQLRIILIKQICLFDSTLVDLPCIVSVFFYHSHTH